jgi:hypothetical protein
MTVERIRGDTYADRFEVRNQNTGDIVNLTGCQAYLTLSTESNPTDTTNQVYQLVGVIDDPSSGIIEFSPDATQANQVGLFFYDVELIDALGVVRTLVKGTYKYIQDITKV